MLNILLIFLMTQKMASSILERTRGNSNSLRGEKGSKLDYLPSVNSRSVPFLPEKVNYFPFGNLDFLFQLGLTHMQAGFIQQHMSLIITEKHLSFSGNLVQIICIMLSNTATNWTIQIQMDHKQFYFPMNVGPITSHYRWSVDTVLGILTQYDGSQDTDFCDCQYT